MSMSTRELAALAADAYNTRAADQREKTVEIGGAQYKILEQVDRPSGYQGTLYQRVDTGELVVAHRGTEFGREAVKDGAVDAGMVMLGINAQERDAMAFTQHAIDLAAKMNSGRCSVPAITVTGHSLGGTLAEITAHRLGLRAETFNAYGAAGLAADYPRVDPDIVNHVRATDFVSAASPHVGEVRVYATAADIDALDRHGYDNGRHAIDPRNPLGVAFGIGVAAHYADNFVDANARGQSILNEDDAARARDNAGMIGDYRRDIRRVHDVLALPRNAVDGVVDLGARVAGRGRRDPAPASAFDAGRCAIDPREPAHPDHALYLQSRDAVHALDASLGRVPDGSSDRLIAAVFRGAREAGLDRVDRVVPSVATPAAAAGASVFAVQGAFDDPLRRLARIDTAEALRTPVEESLRAATSVPPLADASPPHERVHAPRMAAMAR